MPRPKGSKNKGPIVRKKVVKTVAKVPVKEVVNAVVNTTTTTTIKKAAVKKDTAVFIADKRVKNIHSDGDNKTQCYTTRLRRQELAKLFPDACKFLEEVMAGTCTLTGEEYKTKMQVVRLVIEYVLPLPKQQEYIKHEKLRGLPMKTLENLNAAASVAMELCNNGELSLEEQAIYLNDITKKCDIIGKTQIEPHLKKLGLWQN